MAMYSLTILVLIAAPLITVGAIPRPHPVATPLTGRIMGGQDAKIEDYPYMVGVQIDNEFTCGGSILTDKLVLSAAHCVKGKPVESVTVRAGSTIREEGGQVAHANQYVLHPKYDSDTEKYDVTVIELKNRLVFGSTIQPIEIHEDEEPAVGSFATLTGWGYTEHELPLILQMVELPKTTRQYCEEVFDIPIHESMVCYGFKEPGKDACGGDSGSPLVTKGKVVGIVSWGSACEVPGPVGVYANVANKEINEFISSFIS